MAQQSHQTPQETHNSINAFVSQYTFDLSRWCISMAIEKELSSEELLRIIRSKLPAELEKQELHSSLKHQLRDIIKVLHNFARQAQEEAKALGKDVFVNCTFNENDLDRSARKNVDELLECNSFPVSDVVETNISVNHIPDLTYLYSASTTEALLRPQSETILITINPELAVCYEGKKAVSEKIIWKDKNKFIKPEDDEYMEIYNVSAQNQVIHGSGSEKAKRTFENGLLLFAKNQLERIQKELNPKAVHLFFSQIYQPLHNQLTDTISDIMRTENIHLEFVSSDQFSNIQVGASSGQLLTDNEIKNVTNFNTVSDLHEVSILLRAGNVKTLFISTDLDRFGYVTEDGHCYTYPVKGSKKVESIRPWLIKTAIDISADVKIAESENMNSLVAAIPRY